MRFLRRVLVLGLVLELLSGGASSAIAAPALTDGNYRIDLHQGPVLGSTRIIGLAGAYSGIAEGEVGLQSNPAAVVHRVHYSKDWFDYDLGFDYLRPGTFQTKSFDLDGNRRSLPTSFNIFNAGGLLQFGIFGMGIHFQGQFTEIEDQSDPAQKFAVSLTQLHFTVGLALWDHQINLGVGFTLGTFDVNHIDPDTEEHTSAFSTTVPGAELGVLLRLKKLPVRFGAMVGFAMPLKMGTDCDSNCPAGYYLPEGVSVPWQVRVGASYRWSKRPYNKPFRVQKRKKPRRVAPEDSVLHPHQVPPPKSPPPKKKGAALIPPPAPPPPPRPAPPASRRSAGQEDGPTLKKKSKPTGHYYLLVSAEMVVIGAVKNTIGTDGFLDQVEERAGREVVVGARLGVEAEVWKRRLRLRAGTYWEPSRFEGHYGRLHGTVGFALRLFDFKLWGPRSLAVSAAFDGAYQYTNLSISIGFWH